MRSRLGGTALLLVQAMLRDRWLLAGWGLVLVAVTYASAAATPTLYPRAADRVAAAQAIDASPAVVALYGPILDVHSEGELAMTKLTVLYAVFVALLVLVVVRRHTRSEEENGCAELAGGTAVGRGAPLAAALALGATTATVLGLLAAAADVAGSLPVAGSLAFGASWTGIGLVAAGLTALACQLSASTRTCGAVASSAIGLLFLVRAVGDVSVHWLSWLSPWGWSTRLRAWSDPRWWVLLLYAGSALVLTALAVALRARRDLGAGLVAPRPGPARGASRQRSALALALRLHRTALGGWTAGALVGGVLLGSVVPGIGSFLGGSAGRAMVVRLGGRGALEDSLVAAELSIAAVVVTCFAVTVMTRAANDERSGRTEAVLATSTSRLRVLGATAAVALAGASWLLLVTGSAMAVGIVLAGRSPHVLGRVLSATVVQLPAVWLVAALAVAAYSLRPTWAPAGWVLLVGFVTLGQLGELLDLPSWVVGVSPYVHVPRLPTEALDPAPLAVLTVAAVAVGAAACLRFSVRDVG